MRGAGWDTRRQTVREENRDGGTRHPEGLTGRVTVTVLPPWLLCTLGMLGRVRGKHESL